MDKKSSATLAKLARQAGNMYSEVSALFNTPSLVQHFERSWVAHTQMKVRVDLRGGAQPYSHVACWHSDDMIRCAHVTASWLCFSCMLQQQLLLLLLHGHLPSAATPFASLSPPSITHRLRCMMCWR
jgi:hypothetical protein